MPAPQISPLPTPPSRSQSPETFSVDADAFLGAFPDFQAEANDQADYLDALAIDVDEASAAAVAAAAIAAGAANYQGDYNAGTTYQIGESVSYTGRRYVAKTVNTGVTPADGANWFLINDGDVLGPVSATANGIALYDGTTGKIIKDGPAPSTLGNVLTSNGTTWVSSPLATGVSFQQNIQSADYTLVIGDAGKQIFHPVADTILRTYTIPANDSVAFPIGTVVLFTVENGGTRVKVAITSDTLVFGGGTTGALNVPPNNTLMAIKVTATKWMANYLYQTGSATIETTIAVAHTNAPNITAYPWSNSGFGTKYANPASLPANHGNGVAFTPAGDAIAVAHATTPYISAYPWSSSGFGTKFANPATSPTGNSNSVAFSPSGNAIAVAHTVTPYITAYPWSGSGFGTKFADPATPPTGNSYGVAFSPSGNAIAVAHDGTPYISVYPWSGSGFGTKYADPATLPASNSRGVAFSPAGNAIAVAHASSPYITAYPWSGSGFGTKFSNPATLPSSTGLGVAFSPAGNVIAVAHDGTPYISVYPWSDSGFGTKFANPATSPTGNSNSVAFSPSGNAIAVANTVTPYITAYPWTGSGFGTKYANPTTLPPSNGKGVAFSLTS